MKNTDTYPIIACETQQDWEMWLEKHYDEAQGVWLKLAKKAAALPSISHAEAVDGALCYGWIDGLRNRHDEHYFLQKFTPRRAKSMWSRRNIANVVRLTAEGRMQSSGLAEVEAAKRDGRWQAAYESSRNMVLPEDFQKVLETNT